MLPFHLRGIAEALSQHASATDADALLHWGIDAAPPSDILRALLMGSGDVWHAGLLLGMAGQPALLDAVAPTWMYNRDADPHVESTSWRLSLQACLVRTEVVRALGHLDPSFATVEGASLELGHRWMSGGALMRHVPSLVRAPDGRAVEIPLEDELRFVDRRYGSQWKLWAAARRLAWNKGRGATKLLRALRRIRSEAAPPPAQRLVRSRWAPEARPVTVTVLIPTLERYPWLEVVLDQLGSQTVPPDEVVVIDQTAPERRRQNLETSFPLIPLRVIELDQRGQSTARNLGLLNSSGEAILFLDDDDEVPSDLIARHLDRLAPSDIDASCGVVREPGEPARRAPRLVRESPVFPTNNTMLRRRALGGSGLFDVAYDHGIRADGDLGMRLYLSGAHLVIDEFNEVLHHRAPMGGLREYGMRKTTYRGSRSSYLERNKLAATEVYLARRYFTERQASEMLFLRLISTLSRHGSTRQRAARVVVQLAMLARTRNDFRRAAQQATELSQIYPVIPSLESL